MNREEFDSLIVLYPLFERSRTKLSFIWGNKLITLGTKRLTKTNITYFTISTSRTEAKLTIKGLTYVIFSEILDGVCGTDSEIEILYREK